MVGSLPPSETGACGSIRVSVETRGVLLAVYGECLHAILLF